MAIKEYERLLGLKLHETLFFFKTILRNSMASEAEKACEFAKKVSAPFKKVNLLGNSQGGLLARYIVEECPEVSAKVHNLLQTGSPNLGCKWPGTHCEEKGWGRCTADQLFLKTLTGSFQQNHLSAAGYYRDNSSPEAYQTYKETSVFLAPLNNEVDPHSNAAKKRRERMLKLNSYMVVGYD